MHAWERVLAQVVENGMSKGFGNLKKIQVANENCPMLLLGRGLVTQFPQKIGEGANQCGSFKKAKKIVGAPLN